MDAALRERVHQLGPIPDDSLAPAPFKRGWVAFAGNGANSRHNQLFIAFHDSNHLGKALWESPIGEVVVGMDVVDKFFESERCVSVAWRDVMRCE